MKRPRRYLGLLLVTVTALAGCFSVAARAADDSSSKKPKKAEQEPRIHRPRSGKVRGWVLDATTRKPIPGALVQIEVNGEFAVDGHTTSTTATDGRYEAKAPLGRISSRFDWTRLLTLNPLVLLGGPEAFRKQTRVLEVSRLNLRVTAKGYQPFLGSVKAERLQPGKFRVTLTDVWLAPEGSRLASFNPSKIRLEALLSMTVEPRVAGPGETVTVTLVANLPVNRGYSYRAYLSSSVDTLVKDGQSLKLQKKESEGRRRVYRKEIKLPKNPRDLHTEISFYLIRNRYTLIRQRETRELIQVITDEKDRQPALLVDRGYQAMVEANNHAALSAFQQARKIGPTYALGHQLFGKLALELDRADEAVEAYAALVKLRPKDWRIAHPRYAEALLLAGRLKDAEAEVAQAETSLGKNAPMPGRIHLLRARLSAARGDFASADASLTEAGRTLRISEDVLQQIRIARTSQAIAEQPQSPSLRLSYARVLGAAGRWSDALEQIIEAVRLEPRQPWAHLDLANALRHLGREEEAAAEIEFASRLSPDNPEVTLALADLRRRARRYGDAAELFKQVLQRQPRDLQAQHQYALMLYATGRIKEARAQILDLMKNALDKGELQESGIPPLGIYFGAKKRLVRGFSMPEAAADMRIVESLDSLAKNPESVIARLALGSALVEVGLPDFAEKPLREALERQPDLLEAKHLLGMAALQQGRWTEARDAFREVLDANPMHPDARVELARCLTKLGELAQAQAELLRHAHNYPNERPRIPVTTIP